MVDWLVTYYPQNPPDCLLQMDEFMPLTTAQESRKQLLQISEQLASDLIGDLDTDRRNQRARILQKYVPEGSALLRSTVMKSLSRDDVWSWADATAADDSDAVPWSESGLRLKLSDWVVAAPDAPALIDRLRYSSDKLDEVADDLWIRLYNERGRDLSGLLDTLVLDETIAALPMPPQVATLLYLWRTTQAIDSEDEQQAISLAGPLAPHFWPWRAIDRESARHILQPIARIGARRHALQAVVRPFWEAWR